MTLVGTDFASIRIDLLVGSYTGSFLTAFLVSSVPTVVTAFVDMDPTLGGWNRENDVPLRHGGIKQFIFIFWYKFYVRHGRNPTLYPLFLHALTFL